MNQDRLILFNGILDEIKDGLGSGVFGIENDLVLKVEPLECQIDNASALPVVWHLLPCTVDDVCNLISNYEFLILSCKAITDEQSILDLNGAYHVLRELHIHLVHLLSHHLLLLLVLELLLLLSLLLLIAASPHHFLRLLLLFL